MFQSPSHPQEIIELSSVVKMRVDALLARACPHRSRQQLTAAIATLLVNGRAVKRAHVVRPGDQIYAAIHAAASPLPARYLSLPTLYEDEALLVIDKPAGIAVHPAPGFPPDTVTITQALCFRYPALLGWQEATQYRAGIVHRLDRGTSGVLIVAKSERVAHALQQQFRGRAVRKRYLAAVYGQLHPRQGEITAPIARDLRHRARFTIAATGKNAHTIYNTIKAFETYTMVALFPVTGRTHQLRVHMRSIGHPIVGDQRYAPKRAAGSDRLMLHAQRITFTHPESGERHTHSAPLPALFRRALRGRLTS